MATPGWLKYSVSYVVSLAPREVSGVNQSLSTKFAPSVTASFSAVPRSVIAVLFASTSSRSQLGQIAEIMSRLCASAADQPADVPGYVVPPVWLTLSKHPLAAVQAASPYWLR